MSDLDIIFFYWYSSCSKSLSFSRFDTATQLQNLDCKLKKQLARNTNRKSKNINIKVNRWSKGAFMEEIMREGWYNTKPLFPETSENTALIYLFFLSVVSERAMVPCPLSLLVRLYQLIALAIKKAIKVTRLARLMRSSRSHQTKSF